MVARLLMDAYRDPAKRVWLFRIAWAASTGMMALGFAVIVYLLLKG